MIPLRDLLPTRRKPVVTYTIIAMNVAIFIGQLLLGSADGELLVQRFGLVPAYVTGGDLLVPNSVGGSFGSVVTPFTSMFLHGGFMHLLGNMWFLWVFGDNVEDELGRFRFVLFYLLAGLGAGALQVASSPTSTIPMVGASGAISGVLAAYVLLHPRSPVVTLVPLFVILTTFEVPAFVFVFVWFLMQLLNGLSSLAIVTHEGGVAWWAHVGGFLAGLLLVRLLRGTTQPRWEHTPAAARRRSFARAPRDGQ